MLVLSPWYRCGTLVKQTETDLSRKQATLHETRTCRYCLKIRDRVGQIDSRRMVYASQTFVVL